MNCSSACVCKLYPAYRLPALPNTQPALYPACSGRLCFDRVTRTTVRCGILDCLPRYPVGTALPVPLCWLLVLGQCTITNKNRHSDPQPDNFDANRNLHQCRNAWSFRCWLGYERTILGGIGEFTAPARHRRLCPVRLVALPVVAASTAIETIYCMYLTIGKPREISCYENRN